MPALIGIITGFIAQTYWDRVQLFIHGGKFGIADPQFGKDLGFYAFDLPFYRLVLGICLWRRSWRSSPTWSATTSSAASGWPAAPGRSAARRASS